LSALEDGEMGFFGNFLEFGVTLSKKIILLVDKFSYADYDMHKKKIEMIPF